MEKEHLETIQEGQSIHFSEYQLTLDKITKEKRSNHDAIIGHFSIKVHPQETVAMIYPEKRYYWTQSIVHPETAIYRRWFDHVHVILGDEYNNKWWSVKIYERPFILLLWIGATLIVLGGCIALMRHLLYGKVKS